MIYKTAIDRFELCRNDESTYMPMAQVKAKTGCDVICNGFMFNLSNGQPAYNVKLGGSVLAQDPGCNYWGYAWNDGETPTLTDDMGLKDNFITTGVALVRDGAIVTDVYYNSDILGATSRTAIGFDKDGNFILWCSSSNEPKTMEQLRQLMADAGCVTAINLDGGASSECITPDALITTNRLIYSFICVWIEKEDKPVNVFKAIDVSENQGFIGWDRVKPQIDFAMLRAGYGQNHIDKQFISNADACSGLRLPFGVYWFSYALNADMAAQEAAYCLAAIKPYKVQLPVAFDFEYDSLNYMKSQGVTPTKDLCTAIAAAFLDAIEAAGYYAANYTNGDFLANYFDETTMQKHDLWYAAWTNSPDINNPPRTCGIWQYTNVGAIDGVYGDVDVDAVYRDFPTDLAAWKLNNLAASPVPPAPAPADPVTPDTPPAQTPPVDPYKAAYDKLIAANWGDVIVAMAAKI